MKMSETPEDTIDIIDLVSDDEEITPCQKTSCQNVPSSEVEKLRDYVCISCINKVLHFPSNKMFCDFASLQSCVVSIAVSNRSYWNQKFKLHFVYIVEFRHSKVST